MPTIEYNIRLHQQISKTAKKLGMDDEELIRKVFDMLAEGRTVLPETAAEIRNALVPLSLGLYEVDDEDTREDMHKSIKRIEKLVGPEK